MPKINDLPIFPYLQEICHKLKKSPSRFLILTAETGAGKSTAVPLALLNEFPKKILMLEPRRLAATAVACREAELLGEEVGQTAGYRVYLENKTSKRTRLELMTEAIFLRRIQNDPELCDASVIVLDEFHERSVNSDLALAFLKETMELRDDLFVVIMSATIDAKRIAEFCGGGNGVPVMQIPGRTFPVEFIYKPDFSVVQAVRFAAEECIGGKESAGWGNGGQSILVFLPGIGEIKKVHSELDALNASGALGGQNRIQICKLHSSITFEEQKKILQSAPPKTTRVILSSSIAETSVTIPDVVCVIDSGLTRYSKMNNSVGAAHLVTVEESEFSAAQRAGRAGRTQAGKCIRLWSRNEPRQKTAVPEILRSDLSELVLECAEWGCRDAAALAWLDAPGEGSWISAAGLLQELGCVDGTKKITPLGKAVLRLGIGPRLGCVALAGSAKEVLPYSQYKDAPRFLQEKFINDLERRIAAVKESAELVESALLQQTDLTKDVSNKNENAAIFSEPLLAGFPDRIARRENPAASDEGKAVYQFPSGRKATLKNHSGGAAPKYIVAVEADAGDTTGLIYSYKPLDDALAEKWLFLRSEKKTVLEMEGGRVRKTELTCYGKIILAQKNVQPDADDAKKAICVSVREKGFDSLPLDERAKNFLTRLKFLEQNSSGKPDGCLPEKLTDKELADKKKFLKEYLEENAEEWLLPFLTGNKVTAENVYQALYYFYDGASVEQKVPARIKLANGRCLKVSYIDDGEKIVPTVEVIIQQIFGCFETPKILGAPVLLKLLSPARRPLQVTSDLEHFWTGAWIEICKEMKGRYPKHNWDYRVAEY